MLGALRSLSTSSSFPPLATGVDVRWRITRLTLLSASQFVNTARYGDELRHRQHVSRPPPLISARLGFPYDRRQTTGSRLSSVEHHTTRFIKWRHKRRRPSPQRRPSSNPRVSANSSPRHSSGRRRIVCLPRSHRVHYPALRTPVSYPSARGDQHFSASPLLGYTTTLCPCFGRLEGKVIALRNHAAWVCGIHCYMLRGNVAII